MARGDNPGRGWHGDPEGHAEAGEKSPTKFEEGSVRASRAGRKGGRAAQQSGRAHKLTREEQSQGGRNSHENEDVREDE